MASAPSPSVSVRPIDPEVWAEEICRELLAIQAQNRHQSAEQRAELVELRLRERISAVPDMQRRGCLRALAVRFPLPEANGHATGVPAPIKPSEWVVAFDSIKDGMTPELQKLMLEKLAAAGCLPPTPAPAASSIPLPPTIAQLLPKETLDPTRVVQLLDLIFEATRVLDANFRRVWEGVADFGNTDHGLPRSSLEESMRKFLMGDQDVPRVILKTRVEAITKLVPAVMIAVKESWDDKETDLANCLPEEVQKRVKKGPLGGENEAGCWKEYKKAAEKLRPDSRDQEFFGQIVTKARAHIPR